MSNYSRSNDLNLGKGALTRLITVCGLFFLVLPIIIVIIYSFNSSRSVTNWESFSLEWYKTIIYDRTIWLTLKNSITVAVLNTIIATIFGTMIALGLARYNFKGKALLNNLLYVPMIIPEIIFGIAMLSLFVMINFQLGILSIVSAHITFSISFVALIVMAKLNNFDKALEEAALDLGASRWQTFWKVIFPNIAPGIAAGAAFAFTLSIDDFVITFFTSGVASTTLPLKIYSLIKFGVTPMLNAISTILILVTVLVIISAYLLQQSGKLKICGIIIITFIFIFFAGIFAYSIHLSSNKNVLNIGNWADYLSNDVIEDFEKETGIMINLSYFNDPEEIMSKLQTGSVEYDLVVATTAIIDIFVKLNLLDKINFDNIPNIANIDTRLYDRSDTLADYYVPYTYGFTGLTYNSEIIKEPVESWSIFLNEKYKGKMTLIDNVYETIYVGYKILGKKMDAIRPDELAEVKELLIKQKKLLKKYETNLMMELMLNNEIYLCHNWSGGGIRLNLENPKFKFVLPKEGAPAFIEAFCIAANSTNKANAEKFLNYLLRPEVTAKNIQYILYSMPNTKAAEFLPEELKSNKIIFPDIDDFSKYDIWKDFGEDNALLERAWTEIKSK